MENVLYMHMPRTYAYQKLNINYKSFPNSITTVKPPLIILKTKTASFEFILKIKLW